IYLRLLNQEFDAPPSDEEIVTLIKELGHKDDNEEEDEFVHTPGDYVPTDDEIIDDEEYKRINKEMYDDANVELKDVEPANEEKSDQVKDDAHAIVMAALATQKTKVPLQSSSILSDYATKFLNFDNIPSAPATTIPPPIPPFISLQEQSTLIPTPTTTEATTSTTVVLDSGTLSAIHLRVSNLEKEVKELKNANHSLALHATIKSKDLAIVKKYLGTSLDDDLYKKRKPNDADIYEDCPVRLDQGLKRRKTSKKTKPSKKAKSTESSKGNTKSQPKSTGKSAQAEETVFEAGDTQVPLNLRDNMGNTDEPHVINVDPKDWFQKPKRPPTPDHE
nr:hypothetical protein [Tanacetum cinerariifolium]